MQEYSELALALVANSNLKTDELIFKQVPETSIGSTLAGDKSDILIWKRLIEGDKLALGQLYDRYINILFSYGMYHSKDRSYVMDCIHDLFVDLYKYRNNLSKTDNVKYYLFKSLKRKINKKYNKKNISVSQYDFQYETETIQKNHADSCEKDIITEERLSERNIKLAKALKTLTKKQRKIIFLRFNQEKTYEEISEIIGVSVQTARTSIYRAIKALRKLKFH